MQKLFVTYDIAVALKELGFDERCIAFYNLFFDKKPEIPTMCYQENVKAEECYWLKKNICNFSSKPHEYIIAPLWQQVIDWCEEKYNINIYVAYCEYGIKTENSWKYSFTNPTTPQYWVGKYKTKKEAREQAILKAIELIKEK